MSSTRGRRSRLAGWAALLVWLAAGPAQAANTGHSSGKVPANPALPNAQSQAGGPPVILPPSLVGPSLEAQTHSPPGAGDIVSPANPTQVQAFPNGPDPSAGKPGAVKPGNFPILAAAQPGGEIAPILEKLSPDQAAQIPGEKVKQLSDRLIDPRDAAHGDLESPVDVQAGARVDGAKSDLRPAARLQGGPQKAGVPSEEIAQGGKYKPRWWQGLSDRYHYARLYVQNYWWYTVKHIENLWSPYRKKLLAARQARTPLAVTKPREFFSYMRVMGQQGTFYVLGFSSLSDEKVLVEARAAFKAYFNAGGVGAREAEAFEGFLERARNYNATKRAQTYLRKVVRDSMLAASVKPVSEVAAFFDGLLREDLSEKTAEFQAGEQQRILGLFRQAVEETIREEHGPAPDRVIGLLLLGSFATGAANPKSDFDTHLITANGGDGRVAAFNRRLKARWSALGADAANPVNGQDFPYPPSKDPITWVHDVHYLVLSPDQELVSALERKPGEGASFMMKREPSLGGRLGRAVQWAVVLSATIWTDIKAAVASAR